MEVFGYPGFDESGEKILTTYTNAYSGMMMDIRVYRLKAGNVKKIEVMEEEAAILLLKGRVVYKTEGITGEASRENVFTGGPWCLHIGAHSQAVAEAVEDSEILIQKTVNSAGFRPRLYRPESAPWHYSGVGKYGGGARRRVNTIFDIEIAPYSHMVLGEVLNDRGNWSGYLPHRHPQPETYYFLFDRPEGFGASFVGDRVYKSVDGSFAAIPGGQLHPQAVAPGYQMYTCWMIRHLDGMPWHQSDRNEDERYLWLNDMKEA